MLVAIFGPDEIFDQVRISSIFQIFEHFPEEKIIHAVHEAQAQKFSLSGS